MEDVGIAKEFEVVVIVEAIRFVDVAEGEALAEKVLVVGAESEFGVVLVLEAAAVSVVVAFIAV